ncbi:hypothetical protein U1Q18_043299 [Sarracenia purpurea var. burkii]
MEIGDQRSTRSTGNSRSRAVPTGDRPPESSRPRASNEQRRYDVVDGQRTGWEDTGIYLCRGSSPTATSLSSKSRSEATTDRTQAYTCADGDRFAKSKIPSYAFRLIKGLFLRA